MRQTQLYCSMLFTGHFKWLPIPSPLSLLTHLVGLVVRASALRAEDPRFESHLRQDFSGVESYQWLKNWYSSGYPAGAWHYRVRAGTGRPVSVYCDWVRWKVWSATSIWVWQHVKLSEQIHPWDTLVCCWVTKQPTNKPLLSVCALIMLETVNHLTCEKQHFQCSQQGLWIHLFLVRLLCMWPFCIQPQRSHIPSSWMVRIGCSIFSLETWISGSFELK